MVTKIKEKGYQSLFSLCVVESKIHSKVVIQRRE